MGRTDAGAEPDRAGSYRARDFGPLSVHMAPRRCTEFPKTGLTVVKGPSTLEEEQFDEFKGTQSTSEETRVSRLPGSQFAPRPPC